METQARYLWVGAFTLAVIAAGFAFVYWLYTGGGFRDRAVYEIRFDNPVSFARQAFSKRPSQERFIVNNQYCGGSHSFSI